MIVTGRGRWARSICRPSSRPRPRCGPCWREAQAEAVRLGALVDRIRARVVATVPDVEVVGDPVQRLPHW
ncbi:hypothetical protein GCM10020358_27120 [Amorphoplanes nipponensis]